MHSGAARWRSSNPYMASDGRGYDTLGNTVRPSRLPDGSAHPVALIKSKLHEKVESLSIYETFQCTNETKQR
jgi:hypothetical protein